MAQVALGDVPERNAARLGSTRWALRHGGDVLSWGDLAGRSLARAHALSAWGVRQNDRVVLALPNGNAVYEWTFALWKLGATPTVVSHRLPAAELEAIVALAEPRAVIAADKALQVSLGALPVEFGADHPDASPLASKIAHHWKVMTSGGSTGRPKLIVDEMPSLLDDRASGLRVPRDAVVLNPAPLYHNFPFALTHSAMLLGNSVVGMERFDPREFLEIVERDRPEWTSLVPTMMSRIARLDEAERCSRDVSSLQTVWHTAAPIPAWLKRFWIDWLGPERIWEMYGGTEGFATVQIGGVEWLSHPGSVGKPQGVDVSIRDDEGHELPLGQVGEVFMRRAGAAAGAASYRYLGAEPRATSDGYHSFGDFGWLDGDGYLYLADRRTDLIVSGGENVYPAEVEAALMEHAGVVEAIVIGLPDPDLGARVHAIVRQEHDGEVSAEDLLAFTARRLATYKLPRTIEFVGTPLRDESGKVRRSRLRAERIAANADRP